MSQATAATPAIDPLDPRAWYAMRVKAIDGILSGNKQPAIEYLKFVVLHRSRAVADAEHASLIKGAAFEKQRRLDEAAKLAARNRPKPKWQKPSF